MGRTVNSYLVNDTDGQTQADTTFDSNGRMATIGNSHRSASSPTDGIETPTYDGLDRAWKLTRADGSTANTYYGAAITGTLGQTTQQCSTSTYGMGYPVLVVDEAGHKRETWRDVFERVIETDEPNSSGSLAVYTCYTYDLNNNLTGVTSSASSPSQTRRYTYDLLSRITSKTEPETGQTCFYYTTSGGTCGIPASGTLCSGVPTAVCRRTDARGITTTFAYDAANRLIQKTYSDGSPTVSLYYDTKPSWYGGNDLKNLLGRLTETVTYSSAAGQTANVCGYDAIGNINVQWQQTPATFPGVLFIYYTYNYDGSVSSVTYPGGRTVNYTEGNAQGMTAAVDNAHSINYAKAPSSGVVMYAPPDTLATDILGSTGSFPGITESYTYNSRLEVTSIQATSSAGTAMSLAYNYVSGNNGNIATQTNNVTSGRSQSYTYDALNRLLTAQTTASSGGDCWGQSFGNSGPPSTMATDALANLFYTTATQCTAPQPRFTMNTGNNNQFSGTGIGYDADGDMTQDTAYTYTYDAEGRIITASGMVNGPYCYTYNANGLRVEKAHANGGSCTGTVTVDMLYWRNIAGETIAETDGSWSTTNSAYNEYVFFGGRRIAQSNPSSGNVNYYFMDHLGSTRVVTTATGTACYEADYLPYGNENTPSDSRIRALLGIGSQATNGN